MIENDKISLNVSLHVPEINKIRLSWNNNIALGYDIQT